LAAATATSAPFGRLAGRAARHLGRGLLDGGDDRLGQLDLAGDHAEQVLQRLEQRVERVGHVAERAGRDRGAHREVAFRGARDHAEQLGDVVLQLAVVVLDLGLEVAGLDQEVADAFERLLHLAELLGRVDLEPALRDRAGAGDGGLQRAPDAACEQVRNSERADQRDHGHREREQQGAGHRALDRRAALGHQDLVALVPLGHPLIEIVDRFLDRREHCLTSGGRGDRARVRVGDQLLHRGGVDHVDLAEPGDRRVVGRRDRGLVEDVERADLLGVVLVPLGLVLRQLGGIGDVEQEVLLVRAELEQYGAQVGALGGEHRVDPHHVVESRQVRPAADQTEHRGAGHQGDDEREAGGELAAHAHGTKNLLYTKHANLLDGRRSVVGIGQITQGLEALAQ
jgi:hypothetical protein